MSDDLLKQGNLIKALEKAMEQIPSMKYQRNWRRKVAQRTAELYAYYQAGGK